jgi:hypothetical protein
MSSEDVHPLSDNQLRIVAGYYSLDKEDRERILNELKSKNTRQWAQLSERDNLTEPHKFRRRLMQNGVVTVRQLNSLLSSPDARDLSVSLFRYRLYKRRTWAKRRVVAVSYDTGSRWKTSVSMDIDRSYLSAHSKIIKDSDTSENEGGYFNIPVLEVDRREQFVYFDSADGNNNTLQLSLRNDSTQFMIEILIGAIAEEYWDDDQVPLMRFETDKGLAAALKRWFDAASLPMFIEKIHKAIEDSHNSKEEIKNLLASLESMEYWIKIPGSDKSFMDYFKEDITGKYSDTDWSRSEAGQEIIAQIELYEKLPTFVYFVATFTFKWLAYLKVPMAKDNTTEVSSLHFSYVLTRDVLQQSVGLELDGVKKGFPLAQGISIQLPLPMVGQAESDHYTFFPPEGTFISYYPNIAPVRNTIPEARLRSKRPDGSDVFFAKPLPFYVRYSGFFTYHDPDTSLQLSPIGGDGSLATEHITTKLSPEWINGKTLRRVPTLNTYPATNYELILRLRPQLGFRSFVYWLILALSCLLWFSMLFMQEIQSSIQVIPLVAAALAAVANLDRESFLRKWLFRLPLKLVIAAVVIDILLPMLFFIASAYDQAVIFRDMPLIDSMFLWLVDIIPIIKQPLCLIALSLVFVLTTVYSTWLMRHKLCKDISYRAPNIEYLKKRQLDVQKRKLSINNQELLSIINQALDS